MPKWLKKMLRGVLISSVEVALKVGREAGHDSVNDLPASVTNHERDAIHNALDVALDRVKAEIMEEL